MYLPPDAQDRLFDDITALSAPGSRIATEFHGGDFGAALAERAKEVAAAWQGEGFDLDFTDLFYAGERTHVVDYLSGRGWDVAHPQPRGRFRRLRQERGRPTALRYRCGIRRGDRDSP